MERVLGSQGRRFRLKIDCELLYMIVIKRLYKKVLINPIIQSKTRYYWSWSHKLMKILWHICTKQLLWSQRISHLLSNGCVTRNIGVTVGSGVSYAVRAEAIKRGSAVITGES
jgi:hypothetical protein